MKKLIFLLIVTVTVLVLFACGGIEDSANSSALEINTEINESLELDDIVNDEQDLPNEDNEVTANSESDEETFDGNEPIEGDVFEMEVDEGLIYVDITLASTFFEDQSESEIKAKSVENGFKDCIINEDGSVTYIMSKRKHKEMLNDLKKNFDDQIATFLDGEEKVESFVDIKCNDNYSKIDVYVDAQLYTMWDSIYALAFYMTGAFYQSFEGVSNDDIDVVVEFIDSETMTVLNTASYKNYLSNMD